MKPFNSNERLFVYNFKRWKRICETDYSLPEEPSVTVVENGIILPLRRRTDFVSSDATYEGGVCDQTGSFVAGHVRNPKEKLFNLSCTKGYTPDQPVKKRHETVVYGGLLFRHFGHMLQEGMVRLWWYARNQKTQFKFVFLDAPVFGNEFKFYNVLEAIGLTRDRIEIITEPTQFDSVIVPQEAMYMWCNYLPAIREVFDLFNEHIEPSIYEKIYLSRTAFTTKDGVNEQYFEDFFRKRGFKVVYPEQLAFEEQVSLVSGAKEVVGTGGTLLYLTFFCRPGTKVTILNRNTNIYTPMYAIMQARELDYFVIDANFNFLPTNLIGDGVYFYGPTEYWKKYLDYRKIDYEEEEISFEKNVTPYIYDYVKKWGELYANPRSYKVIHNFSITDVVEGIHRVFLYEAIDRKKLPDRDEVLKLKKDNATLVKRADMLEEVYRSAITAQIENQSRTLKETFLRAGLEDMAETLDKVELLKLENEYKDTLTAEIKFWPQDLKENFEKSGLKQLAVAVSSEEIADLQREIAHQKKEIKHLKNKVHGMEDSLSWRITKPLRAFKKWLKRLFG